MKPPGLVVEVFLLGVPFARFVAESHGRRWLRLVFGRPAILLSFGVVALVGWVEMHRAGIEQRHTLG